MYRIDDPSASPTLPTPEAALTEGYWTEGNPATGTPATLERASWFNMVQEELRGIVTAAGLTPSKTTYNQVLTAIKAIGPGLAGASRNARLYLSAASSTATWTADELIVESALGGLNYKLSSLNLTINLQTNGAGGLDAGSTVASGFVAIYVIYNPATGAAALMGKNASALASEVYNGASMPAGYTASALVAVVATNASSQIKPVLISGRKASFVGVQVLSTATTAAALTALSVSGAIPLNAKKASGTVNESSTVASNLVTSIASEAAAGGCGNQLISGSGATAIGGNFSVDITTSQFIYYSFTSSAGTPLLILGISSYEF